MTRYEAAYALIARVRRALAHRPDLAALFARCFPNTLETTAELLDDGTTFVISGDIPAMWLRDSAAQVAPYVPLAARDADLRRMIGGLIRRQARYVLIDPYANAFNRAPNGRGHRHDRPPPGPWVWERKFELDSLCYPLRLCHDYWRATGDAAPFDGAVHAMIRRSLGVMRTEQRHDQRSRYRFERPGARRASDTLPFGGRGARTNVTGMVWSGFRPSDDACRFGFHIPANMFAVVALGYAAELARALYRDEALAAEAEALRAEIDAGIKTHGIVEHPRHGRIYAYETDGFGNHALMDDANVPSLLSIPYLGYCGADDQIYRNTRRFVLSRDNPYYYEGRYARGIGSPHTPARHVWPLALTMQGLTASARSEQGEMVDMLAATTGGAGYMHESFDVDRPTNFTRPWFAWANSLFATLLCRWALPDARLI